VSYFSESGFTAAGIPLINDNKIRLCEKCGKRLTPVYYEVSHIVKFRCPDGHGEWSSAAEPRVEKVIRQPLNAIYQQGAIAKKGQSKGRKRGKPKAGPKVISQRYLLD
jgi:hypothetical protein